MRVAGFASNDLVSLLSATLRTLGTALLPRCFIQTDLENQRLIPVLEGKVGIPVSLLLVWSDCKLTDPKVRKFINFAVDQINTKYFFERGEIFL